VRTALSLYVVFLSVLSLVYCAPIEVTVEEGILSGFQRGPLNIFLGIPYATPPLDNLRWKPPQPHSKWDGVRDASVFAPSCPQDNSNFQPHISNISEDCLYLNIWAPDTPVLKPVMVWIHGGGWTNGGNAEDRLNGTYMATSSGSVVININYRLGAIGYLALAELTNEDPSFPASGNYGHLDQRAALIWVQKNIAKFGGNPNSVTIFGESAGGGSVCFHLATPKSFPYYHKAIIESGVCFGNRFPTLSQAQASGKRLQQSLGCDSSTDPAQILQCLRSKTWKDVIFAKNVGGFGPIIDGFDLAVPVWQIFSQDKHNKVPLISGSNWNEGESFGWKPNPLNETEYEAWLKRYWGNDDTKVLAQYPCTKYNPTDCRYALAQAVGDYDITCHSSWVANFMQQSGQPVYAFVFSHHPSWNSDPVSGAYHSAEIEFVFGTIYDFTHTPQEDVLSHQMTRYWSHFALTGNPNDPEPIQLLWPRYSGANLPRINLNLTSTIINNYVTDNCNFWATIFSRP